MVDSAADYSRVKGCSLLVCQLMISGLELRYHPITSPISSPLELENPY